MPYLRWITTANFFSSIWRDDGVVLALALRWSLRLRTSPGTPALISGWHGRLVCSTGSWTTSATISPQPFGFRRYTRAAHTGPPRKNDTTCKENNDCGFGCRVLPWGNTNGDSHLGNPVRNFANRFRKSSKNAVRTHSKSNEMRCRLLAHNKQL